MKTSYLIESNDFVATEEEVKKIIEKEAFKDASLSIYDIEETPLSLALEDLDTYALFNPQKTIIIKNIDMIAIDEQIESIKHLIRYIENPNKDNLLIIESRGFKEKKRDEDTESKKKKKFDLKNELKKKCQVITIDINPKAFIKNYLKGYSISQETINLLDEYTLGDLTRIKNECDKLINFKADDKIIKENDIKELVTKKLGDSKDVTFAFTKSLGERNIKQCLENYHELLEYNLEPLIIIGMLASQIRIIYQVKILVERHLKDSEIAKMLEENEYRIKKTRELIPFYSDKDLLILMQKLSDLDLRVKTTGSDASNEIELFILNI